MTGAAAEWVDVIVAQDDPSTAWKQIFAALRELALSSTRAGALDRATVVPDRLIANTAWNLWDDFHHHAPTVIDELKKFWVQTAASGTAILLLDALSLRELPIIVSGGQRAGANSLLALKRSVLKSLRILTALRQRWVFPVVRSFSTTSLQHRSFSAARTCMRTCLMHPLPIVQTWFPPNLGSSCGTSGQTNH